MKQPVFHRCADYQISKLLLQYSFYLKLIYYDDKITLIVFLDSKFLSHLL